jgi:hypothetical protein
MPARCKDRQFLRNARKAYIEIIPKDSVTQISNSKPFSYCAAHCFLLRREINFGVRELRDRTLETLRQLEQRI